MSNIWITADTHFYHDKLFDWGDRPKNFTKIIKRVHWNTITIQNPHPTITKNTLIHLGDIAIGQDKEAGKFFKALQSRGIKTILIRGNHDNKSDAWYRDNGWDVVCWTMVGKYFGKWVLFSHMPLWGEALINPYFQKEPILNIHGHFHSSRRKGSLYTEHDHFLVEIESQNFVPYNLKNILCQ